MQSRLVVRGVAGCLALMVASSAAHALPAFARKYRTSCQTCHVAYPKLNAFGQAFRLLGYRMPGETEAQVKEPEVPLGSRAYKRLWPKAVWPGAVPSQVPLSLTTEFVVQTSSTLEDGEVEKVNGDFIFPTAVGLVAAGTAGDNISYFGEIGFSQSVEDGVRESEAEVEHIDLRFIRPIKDSMAFNVKIGAFQPELVSVFDHARRLTVANYDSMFSVSPINLGGAASVGGGGHGGGAGVALPAIATGFEFYGVVKGRIFWTAGIVNGIGPGEETFDGNGSKDVYGRVAYKWGGLNFDGSNFDTYAGSSKNWRERSFTLGLFGYRGDGSDIFVPFGEDPHSEAGAGAVPGQDDDHGDLETGFIEDEDFTRFGLDFNLYYDDLNVFGAYYEADDTLGVFSDLDGAPGEPVPELSGDFSFSSYFLQADLVFAYPWLHASARYEGVNFDQAPDWERATLSLTGLARANVKTTLEYTWDLNESKNYFLWLRFAIAF